MIRIPYDELKQEFKRILLKLSFPENKAQCCAEIFANNSLEGVYSHGLNRFPVFADYVKKGIVNIMAEPERIQQNGLIEIWNGAGLMAGRLPIMVVSEFVLPMQLQVWRLTAAVSPGWEITRW